MKLQLPRLAACTLLLLSGRQVATAHPLLAARQPTPNPLDYLDLEASSVSRPGQNTSTARCAAVLDAQGIVFPNARAHVPGEDSESGLIDCRQKLVFRDLPLGFSFTVIAVEVLGELELGRGTHVEEIGVAIDYLPSSPSSPTLTDAATETTPYGGDGQGYKGAVDLIMNLWPVAAPGESRTGRGKAGCATRDSQPEIELHVRASLGRDEQADSASKGSLEDLRIEFLALWDPCED